MKCKITTWNVNSLKVRKPHVLQFLQEESPDILCLQELKQPTEEVDIRAFAELGYSTEVFGQKTYNGVATLTKKSVFSECTDIIKNLPNFEDPQSRLLAMTVLLDGLPLRIVNGYFPNGETTESEKFPYKLKWLDNLTAWLEKELKQYPNLVLLGDFNIAPEDNDAKHPEEWKHTVLCVPEVRQKFKNLLNLGLVDSFRQHDQPEKIYSWWDYRMKAFQRNLGLRIDHILISEPLTKFNRSVVVNKNFRGLERPSDHAPVTLTLEL
ncbi:exodeoxyribonuclease III [Turicimonas muris]|uniref:Exodeoxyribonuclease III n=3 Tax=Turicimonas muris TaxID=1796652 RepID=A0A227KND0_9BURK|nr:exodeoxyribonuclease III [Turicimonas muris]ANU65943.1 exodeoxyribonuclease III [Burkholderiales bacterium YL45]OXE49592.1 exodeoxyribonuclease III [Turicimonas muris]QQQ97101.1 exodeoxyribonuclease III [Turicimonas muris]